MKQNNEDATHVAKAILKGRLNGTQRMKQKSLLDMLYTPAELAATIGISRRQIYRVYRKLGMPCTIDETKHVFINGKDFRNWYHETYPKTKLEPNQAYCKTCGQGMPLTNPQVCEKDGLTYKKSKCPICERILVRFVENSRKR